MTTAELTPGATAAARYLSRATTALFLVGVAVTPFMRPLSFPLLGSTVQLADAVFALTGIAWILSLALGGTTLRRGRFYAFLGVFFGAMCLTTALAPARSASRIVIELYLLGLSVLAYNIVRSLADLRRTWAVWTATASFTAAAILISVVLFYVAGIKDPAQNIVLWKAGSLPVGNYPRVRGFFLNGNMTGNYLAVSACFAVGLGAMFEPYRKWALAAAAALVAACLFTLSAALGGLAIAVGLFAWLYQKETGKTKLLKAGLPLAGAFAALLLAFTAGYPKKTDAGIVIEPSPRWLTWSSSFKSFLKHPLFGNGLGVALADVHYDTASGVHEHLTDPHDAWLSVAGQMGVVGLCAFVALLVFLGRGLRGLSITGDCRAIARTALWGAFAVVLYQTFAASIEDTRHVWLMFGLLAGVIEEERERTFAHGRA